MVKTWLFDFDDTLFPNQHDYSFAHMQLIEFVTERFGKGQDLRSARAQIEFIEHVIGSLGYRAPNAVNILRTLDRMGAGSDDLGEAMREAYRIMALGVGQRPTDDLLSVAHSIGVEIRAREASAITPYEILATQERIDVKNLERYGWHMERFPTSMREAFGEIAARCGVTPLPSDLDLAYGIGLTAFDETRYHERGLLPGVPETLGFLRERDELILVTKGDPRVQERKFRATGIRRWFGDHIFTLIHKDAAVLKRIAGYRDPGCVTHVGNSIRSDVDVACEAGFGAVYIPCETWAYERKHNGFTEGPRKVKLDRISEMIERYDSLP